MYHTAAVLVITASSCVRAYRTYIEAVRCFAFATATPITTDILYITTASTAAAAVYHYYYSIHATNRCSGSTWCGVLGCASTAAYYTASFCVHTWQPFVAFFAFVTAPPTTNATMTTITTVRTYESYGSSTGYVLCVWLYFNFKYCCRQFLPAYVWYAWQPFCSQSQSRLTTTVLQQQQHFGIGCTSITTIGTINTTYGQFSFAYVRCDACFHTTLVPFRIRFANALPARNTGGDVPALRLYT